MGKKFREVELTLPKDNQVPETFPCPGCSTTLSKPEFACALCGKQIVWIEN